VSQAGLGDSAVSGLKLPLERPILKLKPGADVRLRLTDFVRLAEVFFAEIEKKYS
jgi:hypothetical protein